MHNKNASTKNSKNIWEEACAFFEVMLDDFRSKNLLRRNIRETDRERLNLVWENSRNYEITLKDIFHRFESKGKAEEFAQKCADAGLTKQTVTYLFVSQLIGTYLIELEAVFRTSLLFFLQEGHIFGKKMTLVQLLRAIEKISPSLGTELYSLIDTDLRNCLSHGTFWFKKGGRIFLATNSHLEEVKEISLGKLMIESMKMSIVANALVETLKKKEEQGYF